MATYLVTGGCGYLGSRLVGHLIEQGHYVRVLDNLSRGVALSAIDCIDLNIGDVCDLSTVKRFMRGVDGCFHLADFSETKIPAKLARDIKETLAGGFNIFTAAAEEKTKVVYVSSSAVYGDNAEFPLTEASESCPLTVYAADKRSLELHAKVASLNENIPTVGLRLFNLYGERYEHEPEGRDVISTFVRCALEGKPMTIMGHGQQTRDFVYVDDAIKFIIAAMEYRATVPDIFNISSGIGTSVEDVARKIMAITDRQVPMVHLPSRPGDIYGSIGCTRKARQKLGCVTSTSLNEGLKKLVAFYQRQYTGQAIGEIPSAITERAPSPARTGTGLRR